MPSIWLPFRDVGNVYLHYRDADGTDAVGDGDGSVGVGTRVHHHGIILSVSCLQLVNQHAFVVGLEIGNLMLRESLAELRQVFVEREMTIDFWLAFA